MRLWSISPKYLDRQGILGVWREALLAQSVLAGETKAYINHPQLNRFWIQESPMAAIAKYLRWVWIDARGRGYNFDANKIIGYDHQYIIPVTRGQVEFEYLHLVKKLINRLPEWIEEKLPFGPYLTKANLIELHPLFYLVDGEKESWEKGV